MAGGPTLKLPGLSADGSGRTPYVVAFIINVAIIVLLSTVITVPVFYIIHNQSGEPPIEEHVTYSVPASAPVPRGDTAARRPRTPIPPKTAQPVPPPPAAAPVVPPPTVAPPVIVPTGITPAAGGDSAARGIGRGGVRGLSPGPVDPRLLGIVDSATPPGSVRALNPSSDSAVRSWVRSYWDSIATVQAAAATQRDMTDWTKEVGGKKYGLDPQFIYFGKYRLPTMLLAFLPIYSSGNPTSWERNRQLESIRRDIMFQAARAANEDDFRNAVKLLRDRKEQEHKAAEAKAKADAAAKVKPPN